MAFLKVYRLGQPRRRCTRHKPYSPSPSSSSFLVHTPIPHLPYHTSTILCHTCHIIPTIPYPPYYTSTMPFLYHTYHTTPTIQCPPYHTMPHLPYQIIPAIPYHTQHTIPDQTYNIIPTMLSIRFRAPPTHPGRPRLRDGPMGREDAPCRPNGPPRGPKEDPKTQDGPRAQEAPRRPRWLPRRPKT